VPAVVTFPDFDDVPDRHLEIELEGDGGEFWASRWNDADDHQLEDDLAQIIEEIRLHHGNLLQRKEEERKREEERRRNWGDRPGQGRSGASHRRNCGEEPSG
jgi:hypothetical protein